VERQPARLVLSVRDAGQLARPLETLLDLHKVDASPRTTKDRPVLDKLNDKYGYITIQGNTIEITPAGILRAEDSGVVPDTKVELHRKVRAHILKHLADLHDREGSRAHEGYEKIAEGAPVDRIEMLVDLELLTELAYVKAVSSNSFRITDEGLQHYRGADYEDIV
jgi:hypothetical protein